MRICLVSLTSFPDIGGSQRRSLRYAEALAARGDDVTILTLRHRRDVKSRERVGWIPFVRVSSGIYHGSGELRIGRLGIVPITLAFASTLWGMRRDVDVVHVLQMSPLAAGAAMVSR